MGGADRSLGVPTSGSHLRPVCSLQVAAGHMQLTPYRKAVEEAPAFIDHRCGFMNHFIRVHVSTVTLDIVG